MQSISQTTSQSDIHFTVFKIPQWRASLYQFLSVQVWGNLPSTLQRRLSAWYSTIYTKSYSKRIIGPYLRLNYRDKDYLRQFKPPHGKKQFDNFQDFFTREFREAPRNTRPHVWPCEGLLCDIGRVEDISITGIKGDHRTVEAIFQPEHNDIPKEYVFTNVFLHNKNYHRIHAPISGTISRIQHVPGDLIVLRPWIYKQTPSLPALRNERYNIDIVDDEGRIWYLSIVGGPAVGTIALPKRLQVGTQVRKLEQIGLFYLGSTCCMAAPIAPTYHTKNIFVAVGDTY